MFVHIEGETQAECVRGNDGQKVFCGRRDEVRGDWIRLHNEEIHDMYFSSDILLIISRRMRWAGHLARMGDRRVPCRVLVERPELRRPLGKRKLGVEDNTEKDF